MTVAKKIKSSDLMVWLSASSDSYLIKGSTKPWSPGRSGTTRRERGEVAPGDVRVLLHKHREDSVWMVQGHIGWGSCRTFSACEDTVSLSPL